MIELDGSVAVAASPVKGRRGKRLSVAANRGGSIAGQTRGKQPANEPANASGGLGPFGAIEGKRKGRPMLKRAPQGGFRPWDSVS